MASVVTFSNSSSRRQSATRQSKMNKEISHVIKQRIREAVWKANSGPGYSRMSSKNENFYRRLKINYREAQMIPATYNRSSHIFIRNKCVIEILENRDDIKDHMKDENLPGVQITFSSTEMPTVRFLRLYDGFIFEDGDPEVLEEDPEKKRNFELNEEAKDTIRSAIDKVKNTYSSDAFVDVIYTDLKQTYKEVYKQRYVNDTLMPDIAVMDICVMDLTHRNRGLVMSADIRKMSHYMNELLFPAILVNFDENRPSTILWLSCKDSEIQMTIEVIRSEPNDPMDLELDPEVKGVIRIAAEEVNEDKSLETEKHYRDKLHARLKLVYEETRKDRYHDGLMPDITIEDKCFIDVRARQRGIITLKEKEAIHKCMMSLKWPGVVTIFFNKSFIVILWFGSQNGNTIIEAESIGTDSSGTRLIDLL